MTLGSFLILLGYFIAYAMLLWYATCTIHKRIPMILSIIYFLVCMIPIANYFICGVWSWAYWEWYDYNIELKDNWFNRTFLAYNAE